MHILFIAESDAKYGASHSLYDMISELKGMDNSLQISILFPLSIKNADYYNKFKELGCNIFRMIYTPCEQRVPEKKIRYAIKYLVRGIQYTYGRIVTVNYVGKRMNMDEIDIIHQNANRGDLGIFLSKKYKKPLIIHIREFGKKDFALYSYKSKRRIIEDFNQQAEKFIAISDAVKGHWIEKGLCEDKIVQIYNGVKLNKNVRKITKSSEVFRLIIMGQVTESKGQDNLIKAIAMLPNALKEKVRLDIVGDGSSVYTHKLLELIRENSLEDSIQFLGYQYEFREKLGYYDCGVMCSRAEGFGRVTVEYMMAGLPVIASDGGANSEIVQDGKNGFLYKQGNVDDLCDKLIQMLSNPEKVEKMGEYAKSYAEQFFSAELNAKKIYEEYRSLLKDSRNN